VCYLFPPRVFPFFILRSWGGGPLVSPHKFKNTVAFFFLSPSKSAECTTLAPLPISALSLERFLFLVPFERHAVALWFKRLSGEAVLPGCSSSEAR